MITLDQAVVICRNIEGALAPIGYHCGLTGGVLYRGASTKDVDVIVYPHQLNTRKRRDEIEAALAHVGVVRKFPNNHVASCKDKDVSIYQFGEVRLDLFFLL